MLILYSYPELFGIADNNGYGLKVYAFLELAGVPFVHGAVPTSVDAHANLVAHCERVHAMVSS